MGQCLCGSQVCGESRQAGKQVSPAWARFDLLIWTHFSKHPQSHLLVNFMASEQEFLCNDMLAKPAGLGGLFNFFT